MGVTPLLVRGGGRVWLRRLGWASLVANVGIVLTGGAVRLTSSGLGCPTWPRCTPGSFTPHRALGYHQAIEFGNRSLTFVLTAVAVATLVSAWQSRRRDLRGPLIRGTSKGFVAYVEVLLTGRTTTASYVLSVTASRR